MCTIHYVYSLPSLPLSLPCPLHYHFSLLTHSSLSLFPPSLPSHIYTFYTYSLLSPLPLLPPPPPLLTLSACGLGNGGCRSLLFFPSPLVSLRLKAPTSRWPSRPLSSSPTDTLPPAVGGREEEGLFSYTISAERDGLTEYTGRRRTTFKVFCMEKQ